ncbi:MAG: ferrous iron transport protein B [Melioribacteraceae bacterium]|nr:ferrous iron transport protein B [Melioribacteraceae bacterium]
MKLPMEINVALAGNPNCGKTSLFNSIVGANQKVGNFSGVTVEKVEGVTYRKGYKITIVDLPGTYSLTSYSPEELVARDYLINKKPDVVVDVVDTTNLERNLLLTTQLMNLGSNMIVALNMFDEADKKIISIDIDQLEKLLGAHLVPTSAVKNEGIESLLDHIVDLYTGEIEAKKNKLNYSEILEERIEKLTKILNKDKELSAKYNTRWLAIKLLVSDKSIYNLIQKYPVWIKVQNYLSSVFRDFEKKYNSDPEMILMEESFAFINGALKETVTIGQKKALTLSEKIDRILINRITGLPIFAFFMWLIFQATFALGEVPMQLIEIGFEKLGMAFATLLPDGILKSIIVDGIISGVGGVLIFLPNIMILFFALAILEGTGYMARAAFVIDKVMHKFGLHGKSFIPMITGFGCSVPAFMGTRTLKSESDRITTLLIIPFMSCSAKFPVYILFIGAFFPVDQAGNILSLIYLLGVILALLSAKLLKTTVFKGVSEPFVMELPPYRMPTFRSLFMQMWMKAYSYLRKAGTIILLASVLIWIASNYPKNELINLHLTKQVENVQNSETLTEIEKTSKITHLQNQAASDNLAFSLAGKIGKSIEPIISPLGFDWRLGIALVTGVAAKEIVVSTMGTIYALGDTDEESANLRTRLQSDPNYNEAVAIAFMVFVLLYVPCISATIVFFREAGNIKWTLLYLGYTTSMSWIMAFIAYNITKLFI